MLETSYATEAQTADPLKSVADAMSLAVQAARDGAGDAQQKVSEMMPAIGGFFGRLAYTTCYAISYGVVFPTLFVAQAVPKDNALVHGLVDGARAARDAIGSPREEPDSATGPNAHHGLIVPDDYYAP
jgi:hypothetical protein